MKKKDSAFAEKLLPVLLSTGIVLGLVLVSGQFMELLHARTRMNQTARAYMLEMETTGYLKDSSQIALTRALEEDGLRNVKLTGTTTSEVEYGEPIMLVIAGDLMAEIHVTIPFVSQTYEEFVVPIKMKLCSTSKH